MEKVLSNIDFDESMYINGCIVGSTVITSDNKYLMVTLSGKSMNSNKTDILGGIMETNMDLDSEYVFNVLYAELKEEADINKSEINKINLVAIYRGLFTNIHFHFDVKLSVSSKEIIKRFSNNLDADIQSIEAHEREEYLKILKNHNLNKQCIYQLMTQKAYIPDGQ